ncbi:MAG: biotin--[acetyl-CoA-carboxylase] ligase [Candidatus Fonsibacter sp.]|nr:biotin--[acetyl-CoA-carboxylase] ligase [Candidatus Fonsibacter sp.]
MNLPIFNFTKIESTNDFARSLITEHKILQGIVTADEQIKGRGRYGNKWISPKGNLYFTIFFPALKSNLKKIQFLVQLQIRNILKNYNIKNVTLKWPNDLYINNKKVCGILQESIIFNKFFLIIGIGINIKSSPKIKKYPTTYLNIETKKKINLSELVENLKKAFLSNVIHKKYSFKKIAKDWNKYAFLKNKFINFKITNKTYKGIFRGINNNGALILEHNNHKDYFTNGSLV